MTDDERALHEALFANPVPRDVVRGPGPQREDYLRWNEAIGSDSGAVVSEPGEVVLDVDGIPTAIAPPTTLTVGLAGVVATLAEIERVGLSPADVPNLTIITPEVSE